LAAGGCTNNPYPPEDEGKNYLYNTFGETPKHLDPAIAYSEDQYNFMQQIYEPVVQYHFLKRPYELVPLTAEEVPVPQYFDKAGRPLPADAPDEIVARAVYTIRIQRGIRYQNHAGFAKDAAGNPIYGNLRESDMVGIEDAEGFKIKDTRELIAADYVWQIKRLANPLLQCPILSILQDYIEGFEEYSTTLRKEVQGIRAERRRNIGALYSQERDELDNPVFLDLDKFDFPGVEVVDRYTYRVVLSRKYPQMRYWFAMPFFAPIPKEIDRFYAQGPLVARRITLETNPVGTGPYRMGRFSPNEEIILTRNENVHGEMYPPKASPATATRDTWPTPASRCRSSTRPSTKRRRRRCRVGENSCRAITTRRASPTTCSDRRWSRPPPGSTLPRRCAGRKSRSARRRSRRCGTSASTCSMRSSAAMSPRKRSCARRSPSRSTSTRTSRFSSTDATAARTASCLRESSASAKAGRP
jgi:ABC-type transport system substrate-binding protein